MCFKNDKGQIDCTEMRCPNYDFTVPPEMWARIDELINLKAILEKNVRKAAPPKPEPEVVVGEVIPKYESCYELTLTTTKDDPYEIRQYLHKIVKSNMYEVVYWKACIELTQAGIPHIHAILYSSKKYVDGTKIKSTIKYPYRYTCSKVRDQEAFNKYILKEKNNVALGIYCQEKGIPQIWCINDQE